MFTLLKTEGKARRGELTCAHGTAQTGQFAAGKELKNYWFAGFVPAEQPRYTIVVMQDTQAEPAFSSAAIFARVAAGLEILAP